MPHPPCSEVIAQALKLAVVRRQQLEGQACCLGVGPSTEKVKQLVKDVSRVRSGRR
jgi:hypothetical protein